MVFPEPPRVYSILGSTVVAAIVVSFLLEIACSAAALGKRSVDLSSYLTLPESASYYETALSPKIVFCIDLVNLIKRPYLKY